MIDRPQPDEYSEDYTSYVKLVPEGDIVTILKEQIKDTVSLLSSFSEAESEYRYAPDKWSIKEVIGHMIDNERIMSYRLLCIARGETASLPSYHDEEYVREADFDSQTLKDLLDHLTSIRQSTVYLVNSLSEEALKRRGAANHSEITARAIVTILAGHEIHHCNILKERYLNV
ncbi:DinB family protein [Fictibacillus sp. KU28468]|uniref:DinB family protein n=1 Tax=Fictibacillus sp. KU28468 TaxID=2991053 RepID=UPI00223D6793|nr:DinB family protein [Fictibacillus sp. KU28468]UZJ81213.1 DinB family protein [Fictibacillus sp. KU28468]